jgi:hypothetical protein
MSVRAYMLLSVADRTCEYVVRMLRSKEEVILADRLEDYPNLITMVEAADRQSLAEAIIPVLDCVDGIAEDLRLLITRDGDIPASLASGGATCRRRRVKVTAE